MADTTRDPNGFAFLGGYRYGGRAGELQRQGRRASLLVELGDNYDRYHAHLEEELAALPIPALDDYEDDDEYVAAWTRVNLVVRAELFLRNCRRMRAHGGRLDQPLGRDSTPILDARGRLAADR